VAEPFTPFSLPDLDGKRVGLADFKGRTFVVVAFLRGSSCSHCVDLMIQLEELKASVLARIPVLVVTPEPAGTTRSFLLRLASERKLVLTHTFLVDGNFRFGALYNLTYDAGSKRGRPPFLFLLNRSGQQAWAWSSGHGAALPVAPRLTEVIERLRRP